MWKSRAEPVKQLVSESESEEPQEENDGGSSTEGSESESENQTALAESGKKPVSESSSKEEEEEEDGSESESGSESDGPDVNAQPLATKSVKSAKPAATPSKPVSLKRAPGEAKENQAKKQKRAEAENSEKKQLFQRLWSEEDEIAILKGMIEYAAKKKADPVADLNAFLEFIKKNIHTDVSKTQLQDKIRRLRKKYENNMGKEKDGKNRTFSKPHEQEAYELSKRVWNGEPKLVKKKIRSSKKAAEEEGKDSNFVSDLGRKTVPLIAGGGGGTLEERITTMGDEAFKGGQGQGSKQWNSLKVKEIELYMAQLDVKKAQANLVLDLFKS